MGAVVNLQHAKENMLSSQLRPFGVTDTDVLNSFYEVPRELFWHDPYIDLAYAQVAWPATDSQPSTLCPHELGFMIQAMCGGLRENALLVGANGYVTALLACLFSAVTVIDQNDLRLQSIQNKLSILNLSNVEHVCCDVSLGFEGMIYDAVLVDGSLPQIPQWLYALVAPRGRLLVVEGQHPVMQACCMGRSVGKDEWQREVLFETLQSCVTWWDQSCLFKW